MISRTFGFGAVLECSEAQCWMLAIAAWVSFRPKSPESHFPIVDFRHLQAAASSADPSNMRRGLLRLDKIKSVYLTPPIEPSGLLPESLRPSETPSEKQFSLFRYLNTFLTVFWGSSESVLRVLKLPRWAKGPQKTFRNTLRNRMVFATRIHTLFWGFSEGPLSMFWCSESRTECARSHENASRSASTRFADAGTAQQPQQPRHQLRQVRNQGLNNTVIAPPGVEPHTFLVLADLVACAPWFSWWLVSCGSPGGLFFLHLMACTPSSSDGLYSFFTWWLVIRLHDIKPTLA